MKEELKKVNDFRKTCRSVLLRFYRNVTSNGVMTHSLKNNFTLGYFSVVKFNLNYYFLIGFASLNCFL